MARRAKVPPFTAAEVIERLSPLYGRPVWRPHGDAMTELVLTILSQNTSDANSGRAFMRLMARFGTWEELMAADAREIAAEIQVGGLSVVKSPRIKAILTEVWQRLGSFDLELLREMPLKDAKAWLRSLPGVGPKTAACVLMFALGRPALPVDTHVHRVARRLGFLPNDAGAEAAHETLESVLGPEEVYPFHIALITHGRQLCRARRPLCAGCPLNDRCPSASL